jgi:hypothetical protein
MNEEEKKQLIAHATAILDILEGFKPATERPPTLLERALGTSFADIDLGYEQFDVRGVDIAKIFPEKSFIRKSDGGEGQKQSIIIKDHEDTERELIAWGSDIDKFRSLRVGDRIDILCIKNVKEYTHSKTGKVSTQFTISGNTDISIVKDKEQYQL